MDEFNRADYLTPRELAEIRNVSPQTIYAQTKKGLKEFTITHNNKIYISKRALTESEKNQSTFNQLSTNNQSTVNQHSINNQSTDNQPAEAEPKGKSDFMREQIEKKDELINSLLEQIKELQSQNGDLVELLKREQEINYNNQLIIGQAQSKILPAPTEPAPKEKKKGLFGLFRKKKEENT